MASPAVVIPVGRKSFVLIKRRKDFQRRPELKSAVGACMKLIELPIKRRYIGAPILGRVDLELTDGADS